MSIVGAAVATQTVSLLARKFVSIQNHLDHLPLPTNGYSAGDLKAYVSTVPDSLHYLLLINQIGFIIASTIVSFQFAKQRSVVLGLPTLAAGLSQLAECVLVAGFMTNQDSKLLQMASDISGYRTIVGLVAVVIFGVTFALSLGVGVVSIGRDKRQVVDKKNI